MRIGLFGGTFNPIHCGHLHIANEICRAFPLDRVILIPCAIPPHKERFGLAAAHDRLKMIRLALSESERLEVSQVELNRRGPSYSVDTVKYFLSQSRIEDRLFMLVGLDAFLELDTWKDYLEILRLMSLIVMPRPVAGGDVSPRAKKQIKDLVHTKLSEHYVFDPSQSAYFHPALKAIYEVMTLRPLDVSSTNIRTQISKGRSVNAMVPKQVSQYIANKGLYR